MNARASLLESPPLDAAGQMALDEAALERADWGPGALRFYRWTGPAVTFGYSRPYAEAKALAEKAGLGAAPAVRRPTGGGTVLHDGDLTFSWVFPWPALTTPRALYKDLHRAAHLALAAAGLKTRLWSDPQAAPSDAPACFPRPACLDLVAEDGRKLLGGALRRRKGWGLYQGSMRTEGLGRTHDELETALAASWPGGPAKQTPMDAGLRERAEALVRERYASEDWNRRR